jgi:hypothetical protein
MNRTLGAWELRPDKSRRGVNDQTAVQHLLMTALSMRRLEILFFSHETACECCSQHLQSPVSSYLNYEKMYQ